MVLPYDADRDGSLAKTRNDERHRVSSTSMALVAEVKWPWGRWQVGVAMKVEDD